MNNWLINHSPFSTSGSTPNTPANCGEETEPSQSDVHEKEDENECTIDISCENLEGDDYFYFQNIKKSKFDFNPILWDKYSYNNEEGEF